VTARAPWLLLVLVACSIRTEGLGTPDAGASFDAGPPDAQALDAREAGATDSARPDAGRQDAEAMDTGPDRSDAGPPDAGPPDAGPPDAGPPDAGPPDAGPPDAGPPDAGPPDAGPPDAGPRPCRDIYGPAPSYFECAERATECEFYVALGGSTANCAALCAAYGGACIRGFRESEAAGDPTCAYETGTPRACDVDHDDEICVCSRPA